MPTNRRPRLRAAIVAATCAACATVASASYIPTGRSSLIVERNTCPANHNRCTTAGLPADSFCCPSGSTCLALAANTTTLCCPEGRLCDRIHPITCDLSLQDPEAHPASVVQTTVLDGVMARCGVNLCCPFGYSCNSSDQCQRDADQSAPPRQSSSSPPSSSSSAPPSSSTGKPAASSTGTAIPSSSSSSSSSSATAAPQASSNNDAGGGGSSSGSSTVSIVGGVIGGVVGAIALGILVFCFLRRKRRSDAEQQHQQQRQRAPSPSNPSYGNQISNPIMVDSSTMRTDFNRKAGGGSSAASSVRGSSSGGNPFATPTRPLGSPGSYSAVAGAGGGGDKNTAPSTPRSAPIPPIRGMRGTAVRPVSDLSDDDGSGGFGGERRSHNNNKQHHPPLPQTPPRQRQGSLESIEVFADPSTVGSESGFASRRNSNLTTFTSMMREADLGYGPYVPNSTHATPDRRR